MITLPVLDCLDNCGACCMKLWRGRPPFMEDEQIPDIQIIETVQDSPCCWFDLETKRCRHYEQRPKICRDFVVGSDNCLTCRTQNLSCM